MTILFGPDGIIKDEDKVPQHSWDVFFQRCIQCGMAYKYYEETITPCTTDIMPV